MMKMQKVKSIQSYTRKLKKIARGGGEQVTYSSLLMYYAFRAKGTACWAKHVIFGSIAYLLTPIDTVPDLTPVFGYTDDLGVLTFGLVGIACYITEDVRKKAVDHLGSIFKNYDQKNIDAIDSKL